MTLVNDDYDHGHPRDPAAERLFEARIVPHRSLSKSGFRILMALFTVISVASAVPFVLFGAWPVAGFMGLDVAIVYLAFRANFRAARAYEDILVTPLALLLAKVTAAAAPGVALSSRLGQARPAGARRVRLAASVAVLAWSQRRGGGISGTR